MSKLAILVLAAVAFQAAFAGVPRFFGGSHHMVTTWDFENVDSKEMVMHVDMFFNEFCHHLEYNVMDKEVFVCYMENFIRFLDMLCMKLECTDCTDKVFMDCVMVCKNIKMECERMMMHTDLVEMKMQFISCLRMFCMEFTKWCMHTDVCARLMHKDVHMHLRMMMDKCSHMGYSGMMMMGGHLKSHTDLFMRFKMMCHKFVTFCESTNMSKDMIMECMRKCMTIIDYTIEKLCVSGKCDSMMMSEICMELRHCKMMIERCLSHGMLGDFHTMKMECCECIKMFWGCMEKWMMCDNCCFGYETIFEDIYMRFMIMCNMWMTTDMHHDMPMTHYKRLPMHMHMLVKKFLDFCESGTMSKDTMMMCMRKFMMILDYTMEKMCHDPTMTGFCMELKNCKMMLERCLGYGMFTDVHKMRMECCECIKMFFDCCEKMMMCDGFEMIWSDICVRFESLCHVVFNTTKDFSVMMPHMNMHFGMDMMHRMPYFLHRYMKY